MDRQVPQFDVLHEDGRSRLLVDSITDYAIYMLDPDGVVASWNAGAERSKGYAAHEIIGRHFSTFYTDADRLAGLPDRGLAAARETGRFETEGWRVRKDGSRYFAHAIIDRILSPRGELLGYAKITRDLTERRAAEEALRASQEQFRLLVQGVTDYAIYMIDPSGLVTNWNAGAQRIKGYLPSEIIGSHFSRFYTDEEREAGAPARALRIAAEEGRYETEGWRVRKDGSRFFAHVIIDRILDPEGRHLGFAKITRDITERREAMQALDDAREALFQSQKMDAIGRFTGGVAHDFNNLLMAVLGSLELVKKRQAFDARISPLIDNAIQGAQRGAALTQRMLAFARKQELKLHAVDVPALVEGMTDLLQRSITPTIRIETVFPPALPPALTDANQLETALLNMAVNARDAMPDGGTLRIEASAEHVGPAFDLALDPGAYVRLTVADTGHGMDAETLTRVVEPFYTTKDVGKGTGLGLSMVHGLAEQSGGRLNIRSQPGKGTVVELWFPQARIGDEAPIVSRSRYAARDTRPLSILVVDDDGLVLLNTVAMLEDLGHRVFDAISGPEALHVLEREQVDLIISDYAMPGMTGLQLAEAIRARRPEMPFLLATGYAELPADSEIALRQLDKPFNLEDLASALAEAMQPA